MGYLAEKGYNKIIFVAGSDRVPEYEKRWLPYAQEHFAEASVVSAGQRDPDAEGATGMSGTRAREAAATGDLAKFRASTGWEGELSAQLMNAVKGRLPEGV